MFPKTSCGPSVVRLQNGEVLSLADLPCTGVKRWTAARKRCVVRAVLYKIVTADEIKTVYQLSDEEFSSWLSRYAHHRSEALKETKIKKIRYNRR